ncbi:MAG: hypothetical protein ACLUEQ_02440 [Cloacibacillus evryensis]
MSRTKVPRSIYLSIEYLPPVSRKGAASARCSRTTIRRRSSGLPETPLPRRPACIRTFLADMHDPVVIRSSSRLEDDVKHSFAGKLTNFLGNNCGNLEGVPPPSKTRCGASTRAPSSPRPPTTGRATTSATTIWE